MKKSSNYLWGILFIVVGIIFGLNSFGITNINILFRGWWTFFIIIPCFINLFDNKEDNMSNLIGLLIGIFLFLGVRGIINFEVILKLIVPTIMVIIGLSLIFKDSFVKKVKKSVKIPEYCATFGERKVNFSKGVFDGCDLSAIFGEIKCDLHDCQIKDDVSINVLSLFGSTNILVPTDVNVKVKSTPIFGGVKNSVLDYDEKNKTIYINATCIFGGVDVR